MHEGEACECNSDVMQRQIVIASEALTDQREVQAWKQEVAQQQSLMLREIRDETEQARSSEQNG
jgi:hypothetical protein